MFTSLLQRAVSGMDRLCVRESTVCGAGTALRKDCTAESPAHELSGAGVPGIYQMVCTEMGGIVYRSSSASLSANASPRKFSPTITPSASMRYIAGMAFT